MFDRSAIEKLAQQAAECRAAIIYTPHGDELDLGDAGFPIPLPDIRDFLTQDKNDDPFALAAACEKKFFKHKICVFVPGQKFDKSGTRHGRGGGWFDRFLSKIPASWIRVGVTPITSFSTEPLPKEAWDQPVDWVLIKNGAAWSALETHARIEIV